MKVKTFTFEDNTIFYYNKNYEEEKFYREDYGEYYYKQYVHKIDDTINNFINNNEKEIEIIDIKINSIVKGNNPPTSILVYTLIYKESEMK